MAACRAGDDDAWEELVRRYERLIYTVPLSFGFSEDEAADVFQQTCVTLYEHLDRLREPDRLDAWLVSTARRLALHVTEQRRRRAAPQDGNFEQASDEPPIEERLALLEEQQRLRIAVARLDPRCRALMYHLFYDPATPSYQQIAAQLGIALGSVGPVRARCFSKLKAIVEAE